MKKLIITIFTSLALLLGFTSITATPVNAADSICEMSGVSDEVKKASGCDGGSEKEISDSIIAIINGIIAVLAIVAVIVIIYAGIQYMTSAGDASKLKRAKDTLLYAVIGLIICALAAGITNFAIGIINNNQSSDSSSSSSNNSFYTTYDSSQYDKPTSVK
ncbi:hypothetical protein IKG68_02825 [Candidatus Saccharibacteria bacterium]|nr:hypothetical protein [Candidatus Saccharibacteria bacterium]